MLLKDALVKFEDSCDTTKGFWLRPHADSTVIASIYDVWLLP